MLPYIVLVIVRLAEGLSRNTHTIVGKLIHLRHKFDITTSYGSYDTHATYNSFV